MSELARGISGAAVRRAAVRHTWTQSDGGPVGRHAFNEDAVLTPIFHALTHGGRRGRRLEPAADPLTEFHRDPLAAPIPVQALAPVPAAPTRLRSLQEVHVRSEDRSGRHRQLAVPAGPRW